MNTVLCSTLESWLKDTTHFSLFSTSVANLCFGHFKMSLILKGIVIAKQMVHFILPWRDQQFYFHKPKIYSLVNFGGISHWFSCTSVLMSTTETSKEILCNIASRFVLSQRTCTHWCTNFVTVLGNLLYFIEWLESHTSNIYFTQKLCWFVDAFLI